MARATTQNTWPSPFPTRRPTDYESVAKDVAKITPGQLSGQQDPGCPRRDSDVWLRYRNRAGLDFAGVSVQSRRMARAKRRNEALDIAMKTLNSNGALNAGILFTIIVTNAVDLVLHAVHFFPAMDKPIDDTQALVATLYRVVISIAGAYLTAKLAPDRPMSHAIWLGLVGTVLGVIGVCVTWNSGLGPRWYGIALAVLACSRRLGRAANLPAAPWPADPF